MLYLALCLSRRQNRFLTKLAPLFSFLSIHSRQSHLLPHQHLYLLCHQHHLRLPYQRGQHLRRLLRQHLRLLCHQHRLLLLRYGVVCCLVCVIVKELFLTNCFSHYRYFDYLLQPTKAPTPTPTPSPTKSPTPVVSCSHLVLFSLYHQHCFSQLFDTLLSLPGTADAISNQNPTPVPTLAPLTLAPVTSTSFSLETTQNDNNGADGNFFDLQATNGDIQITGFDINIKDAGVTFTAEIYSREGSYQGHETSLAGWTKHDTITSVSPGSGALSPLVLSNPILISAGVSNGMRAFHVTLINSANTGIRYTNGSGEGNLYVQDSHLSFYEGRGSKGILGSEYFYFCASYLQWHNSLSSYLRQYHLRRCLLSRRLSLRLLLLLSLN